MSAQPVDLAPAPQPGETLDALVIGCGVSGIYQLYCLKNLGLKVQVLEAGGGVGGTWYWNRYPGARFDSESYSYAYSFSKTLLEEWNWAEHYSAQPENEAYLNHVVDKFALRPCIRFHSRVKAAHFDDATDHWRVETEDGYCVRTRFLISAVGILSAHHLPDIPGIERFQGTSFHTARWPHAPVDLRGKRVGVIGAGATAIQLIPRIAPDCGQLVVFQRTANYACPLRNAPITDAEQAALKARYDEIFERCRRTFASFMQESDPRFTFQVPEAERLAFYEHIWSQPGFNKWFGCFHDIMFDDAANEEYARFVRDKIRARVKDPAVADLLVPRDHPFGAKRIPLETNYYETYNRDNVLLVDVKSTPITEITPQGVRVGEREYPLDVIIYATGFDAITGELTRMDIRGEQGVTLAEKWGRDGPSAYLTLLSHGFPNFFIANGAVFCNFTRCAEVVGDWVRDCIGYLRAHGHTRIEADPDAEATWAEHAASLTEGMLFTKTDSWFMGSNVPGKKRQFLFYAGGMPAFRARIEQVAKNGYEGFRLR